MKTTSPLAILLSIIFASFSPALLFAQPGQPGMGRGSRSGGWNGRMYDPKTVVTVNGKISEIQTLASKGRRMQSGVHLMLKTDEEVISIHLGPSWFLDEQKVKLASGDKIEVTGSRIDYRGSPAIIAKEIHKGDQVIKLRSDDGVPAWHGRGRGRR